MPLAQDDLVEETTRLGGSGRMAGVVFVLEFLEFFLVFPEEDLGSAKMPDWRLALTMRAWPSGVVAPWDLRPFSREAAICF